MWALPPSTPRTTSQGVLALGKILAGDGNQSVGRNSAVDGVAVGAVVQLGVDDVNVLDVGGDLSDGVDGLENVLGDAVVIVVDDDQAVAATTSPLSTPTPTACAPAS